MKLRFILFRRGNTYYCEDTNTGQQTRLRTKDAGEAQTLLNARTESVRQPVFGAGRDLAKNYVFAADGYGVSGIGTPAANQPRRRRLAR